MTLLSKEEIADIRDRARGARATGESEILADDIDRLLSDLAATPPLIVIAPKHPREGDVSRILRALAKTHHGPVYVLPFGWCEADDEQRETLARRIRHVERATREECAKIAEGFDVIGEARPAVAYQIAADIRALNEAKP